MSFLIKLPVTESLKFCAFSEWYGRFAAIVIDIVIKLITVISTVSKKLASFNIYMFQNRNYKINIISLSLAEHYVNWIAISFHCSMDFCTWTTAAVALTNVHSPCFSAAALCLFLWPGNHHACFIQSAFT